MWCPFKAYSQLHRPLPSTPAERVSSWKWSRGFTTRRNMRTSCLLLALVCAPAHAFAPGARALSPARSVQAPLRQPTRAAATAVRMQDDAVDPIDRAFAAAVYLFPITDGIFFGKFLFTSVPVFGALCLPILQASAAFDSARAG